MRVGEDFPPAEVTEVVRAAAHRYLLAIQIFRDLGSRFIFRIDAAATQCECRDSK